MDFCHIELQNSDIGFSENVNWARPFSKKLYFTLKLGVLEGVKAFPLVLEFRQRAKYQG